jgi:glycosyltransferase involved in cell wall biosynthesis/peptidoglycan/xylan/chitin deacetylase (PgdA/CDA1 family)
MTLTGDCPSFSIVVPTYQRRDLVCDAVRALCSINYAGPVDIIVVIDGSTDGTAAALRQLQGPWPLQVIEQSNRGASAARNRGASEASADIILFIDDDMICEPDLLEQHARMYREGADAVIGDTPIDPDSAPGFLSDSIARWIEAEQVRSPLAAWDIFTGQLSVRRSVFNEVGGFDEAFTSGESFSNEDADLGVRLLSRFEVRHNSEAITRQRYVVTPREYMARAPKAVAGDLHFLAKNPQYSRELFDARGMGNKLGRLVYIPLSRIPLVPKMLSTSALWAAEIAMKTRFRSNRLLARYYSGSRSVAFWAALREKCRLPGSERLLVLGYHAIRDQSDDPVLAPYGVAPEVLTEHLDLLSSAGFTFVTPASVANFLLHGAPLPRRPLLLTFDDCYQDLLETAREVLQPRAIPALAFAVTAMTSGTNEWDQAYGSARLNLLTPQQLRELAALGVEIGSHSRTHREMPLLDGAEQETEAAGSSDDLVAQGLPRPRFFAYPFGSAGEGSKTAVRKAGYLAAFGCRSDCVTPDSDRLDLPRVVIFASDRGWRFRAKVLAPRLFSDMEWLHQGIRNRFRKIRDRASGTH